MSEVVELAMIVSRALMLLEVDKRLMVDSGWEFETKDRAAGPCCWRT